MFYEKVLNYTIELFVELYCDMYDLYGSYVVFILPAMYESYEKHIINKIRNALVVRNDDVTNVFNNMRSEYDSYHCNSCILGLIHGYMLTLHDKIKHNELNTLSYNMFKSSLLSQTDIALKLLSKIELTHTSCTDIPIIFQYQNDPFIQDTGEKILKRWSHKLEMKRVSI
jgi:hypothetical protein